jgi:hypothetical protein
MRDTSNEAICTPAEEVDQFANRIRDPRASGKASLSNQIRVPDCEERTCLF